MGLDTLVVPGAVLLEITGPEHDTPSHHFIKVEISVLVDVTGVELFHHLAHLEGLELLVALPLVHPLLPDLHLGLRDIFRHVVVALSADFSDLVHDVVWKEVLHGSLFRFGHHSRCHMCFVIHQF